MIDYWFVAGKITGNSRNILIMSLKAPNSILAYRHDYGLGTIILCLHFGGAYQTGLYPPPGSVHCCTKRPPSVYCCYKEKTHYKENVFYSKNARVRS